MSFEFPWLLALLVPWSILAGVLVRHQREAIDWLRRYVAPAALGRVTAYAHVSPGRHLLLLWVMGAVLVLAAAGPYAVGPGEVKERRQDVLFLVDASLSMLAGDARDSEGGELVTRFNAARTFALALVEQRPGSRFGLITFAGTAAVHAPLTIDHIAVKRQLEGMRLHQVTQSNGSEFAQALGAVIHLSRGHDRGLHVVLLSDGDLSPNPMPFDDQLAVLSRLGVPVHTVAFGSERGQVMEIWHPDDVADGKKTKRVVGRFQTAKDLASLERIAGKTGGEAFDSNMTSSAEVSAALDDAPARTVTAWQAVRVSYSSELLAVFLVLFLFESRLFRRRAATLLMPVLVGGLSGCSCDWRAAHRLNEQGRENYEQQEWPAAAMNFEQSAALGKRPWIPAHNLARVYAQELRYAEAHALLEEAVLQEPGFGEGYFGDGVVLYEWGVGELELPSCRVERTCELWVKARGRFEQAQRTSGWFDSLDRDGEANARVISERLAQLQKLCPGVPCDPESAPDGGADGGEDAGSDGGTDGGSDGGTDGGEDAGTDGGTDGGSDGGTDGGEDAGTDGGTDGGSDGGTDGGEDAGADGGADAGASPPGDVAERALEALERARAKAAKHSDVWSQVKQGQRGPRPDGGYFVAADGGKPQIWW